jgi:hypothetical protein
MMAYGDDAGFDSWLAANGYTLPSGAPAPAVLRQRASAYLDALYEVRLPGVRTGGFAQERAWPRAGAEVYGQAIPDNVVPPAIEQAVYAAAHQEALSLGSLSAAVSAAGAVKRERVEGAVDIEYFEGSGDVAADATIKLSVVEGLMAPFFGSASLGVFVV